MFPATCCPNVAQCMGGLRIEKNPASFVLQSTKGQSIHLACSWQRPFDLATPKTKTTLTFFIAQVWCALQLQLVCQLTLVSLSLGLCFYNRSSRASTHHFSHTKSVRAQPSSSLRSSLTSILKDLISEHNQKCLYSSNPPSMFVELCAFLFATTCSIPCNALWEGREYITFISQHAIQ